MAASTRTHYDVLGISRDADAAAVRSAWKLHVQAWHPDRFGVGGDQRDEAERQTQRINEAYSVLRDSGRRAAYDCSLAAEESAGSEPTRFTSRPHRPAAAPVGSPMATTAAAPAEPATLGEQIGSIGRDAWQLVRRHPRVFAAVACTWLVVMGGSVAVQMSGSDGPPRGVTISHSSIVTDDVQLSNLEDLAARAREEAAAEDAQMRELMAQDARRAEAEDAAARRAEQQAARKGPAARKDASRDGRRIVRVLPDAR